MRGFCFVVVWGQDWSGGIGLYPGGDDALGRFLGNDTNKTHCARLVDVCVQERETKIIVFLLN